MERGEGELPHAGIYGEREIIEDAEEK